MYLSITRRDFAENTQKTQKNVPARTRYIIRILSAPRNKRRYNTASELPPGDPSHVRVLGATCHRGTQHFFTRARGFVFLYFLAKSLYTYERYSNWWYRNSFLLNFLVHRHHKLSIAYSLPVLSKKLVTQKQRSLVLSTSKTSRMRARTRAK